jgi:hypothetical protein
MVTASPFYNISVNSYKSKIYLNKSLNYDLSMKNKESYNQLDKKLKEEAVTIFSLFF